MKNSVLLHKNSTYSAIENTMRMYQSAYLGGLAFKRDVRKKRPSEDEKIHNDVVNNTSSMPIARYIVDTLNDTVFGQQITRELEFASPTGVEIDNEQLTQWTELMCYDADLQNRSFDAMMENIGDLTSIYGHCWVFVDQPSSEEGNAGRPYVVAVSPLDVWDWRYTPVNGKYIPSFIKVVEHETSADITFKLYYLGTTTTPSRWEQYRVVKLSPPEAEAELLAEGTFPPGMSIPGFMAYTRRDPRSFEVGVSDIDTATDVQREVYKLECEAYQSIQFARTLIRADAGIKVPAHAGAIVRGPLGSIETMSVDTQDVNNIIAKQTALLDKLEHLSGFGGIQYSSREVQSGISIIEQRRQLHKMAAAKARQMEVCEEMIWTYAARYMGMRWAGEVSYGTDYENGDSQYQLALLQTAKNLSGDNVVIQGIITNKLLEFLVDADELSLYREKLIALSEANEYLEEPNEQAEVETRDIGDQTPKEVPEEDKMNEADQATDNFGIRYTGISSYNPIADQLVARASGR